MDSLKLLKLQNNKHERNYKKHAIINKMVSRCTYSTYKIYLQNNKHERNYKKHAICIDGPHKKWNYKKHVIALKNMDMVEFVLIILREKHGYGRVCVDGRVCVG